MMVMMMMVSDDGDGGNDDDGGGGSDGSHGNSSDDDAFSAFLSYQDLCSSPPTKSRHYIMPIPHIEKLVYEG